MDIEKFINFRKELHKMPEEAFKEDKTRTFIKNALKDVNGLELLEDKSYLLYRYFKGEDKKSIVLRCDMDSIVNSKKTRFHGCGHDGHMAIMLGTILSMDASKLDKNVYFLFQAAEETGYGALDALEIFDKYKITEAYGLHNYAGIKTGTISTKKGLLFLSSFGLKVNIVGRQSHASIPENSLNPIYACSEIIKDIEPFIKKDAYKDFTLQGEKFSDNIFITVVGVKLGGENFGVSPANLELDLTLRAYNDDDLAKLKNIFENKYKKSLEEMGFVVELNSTDEFLSVVNDEELYDSFTKAIDADGLPFEERKEIIRSSEDFGYYRRKARELFFLIGVGEDHKDIHDEAYEFNDEAIENGVKAFLSIAYRL